jgi:hypothetical protein
VFKIFIHIDAIEDLSFYHFPREELVADDKIPWHDFSWQYGMAGGDIVVDTDLSPPPFCASDAVIRRYCREGDDDDRDQQRPRSQGFLNQVSSWFDGHSRSRRQRGDADHSSG